MELRKPPNVPNDARWWELYKAAMIELDAAELQQRIKRARSAIVRRSEELAGCDGHAADEKQWIEYALEGLRTLERLEVGPAHAVNKAANLEKAML